LNRASDPSANAFSWSRVIPKLIEFPAALPRTSSGKVLRRDLRERMIQQLTAVAIAAPSGSGQSSAP
jgi:hypothetical protein